MRLPVLTLPGLLVTGGASTSSQSTTGEHVDDSTIATTVKAVQRSGLVQSPAMIDRAVVVARNDVRRR